VGAFCELSSLEGVKKTGFLLNNCPLRPNKIFRNTNFFYFCTPLFTASGKLAGMDGKRWISKFNKWRDSSGG
jgi:hypothetical protein